MKPEVLESIKKGDFERLCLQLLKQMYPKDKSHIKRRGELDAPDKGIDIEGSVSGKKWGLQCTSEKIKESKMKKVFQRIKDYPHALDRFILCFSKFPTPRAIDEFHRLKKNARTSGGTIVNVEYWDPDTLVENIKPYPKIKKLIYELLEFPSQFSTIGMDINIIGEAKKLRNKLRDVQEKVASISSEDSNLVEEILNENNNISARISCSPDKDLRDYSTIVEGYTLLKLKKLEELKNRSSSMKLRTIANGCSTWGAAATYLRGKIVQTLGSSAKPYMKRNSILEAYSCWNKIRDPVKIIEPVLLPGIRSEVLPELLQGMAEGYPDPFTLLVPVPYRYRAAVAIKLADFCLCAKHSTKDNIELARKWLSKAWKDCNESRRTELSVKYLSINIQLLIASVRIIESILGGGYKIKDIFALHDDLRLKIENAHETAEIPDHKYLEWTAYCLAGQACLAKGSKKRTILEELSTWVKACLDVNGGRTTPFQVDAIYRMAHLHTGELLTDEFSKFQNLLEKYEKE